MSMIRPGDAPAAARFAANVTPAAGPAALAVAGDGPRASYGELALTGETADWRPDGHGGKHVTVGDEEAVVLFNTVTRLELVLQRLSGHPRVRVCPLWMICGCLSLFYRMQDRNSASPSGLWH
jgi:hypothetical protein